MHPEGPAATLLKTRITTRRGTGKRGHAAAAGAPHMQPHTCAPRACVDQRRACSRRSVAAVSRARSAVCSSSAAAQNASGSCAPATRAQHRRRARKGFPKPQNRVRVLRAPLRAWWRAREVRGFPKSFGLCS